MSGCFGLLDTPQNRVDPESLTEAHPVVDSRLATDWSGNLTLDGQPIRTLPHPSLPLRGFECPRCKAFRYRLYRVNGEWRCRFDQPALDYASRHRHRSVPGLARLAWLRKRIGADPRPFSAIAPRRLNARRYWRIAREIREIEERLVEHLRVDVGDVLERRLDARRRNR